jgi:hypothetical protein
LIEPDSEFLVGILSSSDILGYDIGYKVHVGRESGVGNGIPTAASSGAKGEDSELNEPFCDAVPGSGFFLVNSVPMGLGEEALMSLVLFSDYCWNVSSCILSPGELCNEWGSGITLEFRKVYQAFINHQTSSLDRTLGP